MSEQAATPAANWYDRLVGTFNPDRALRQIQSRKLLHRAYEGASRRDGWRPKRMGASANTDHRADAAELRGRSRALHQNVPYIAQALRALSAAVVGTGITPRWQGNQADRFNALWAAWAPYADADGRMDVYGLQSAAYRAMEQDGEVLLRIRPRRASDGLPVPLQFQLLEIDWLDSSRNETRAGNNIVNGIEYDALGRVAFYWLFDQHPGEITSFNRGSARSSPVSAASIIHLFTPERPGQGRGFPRIAPVVARVRDLQLYEDAELQRKNLESRLSVLASGPISEMANPPEAGGGVDAAAVEQTRELGPLSSGGITQVPAGTEFQLVEPKAAPGYVDYLRYNLHLVAAGYGVTYEMMTGDVSEANFSSARVRLLDFRREAESTQWLTLIPKLCERMCRAFADACELAGLVSAAVYTVEHSTPKWDYVNPVQDVRADLEEISGGLSSISEKLRRRGYKPEQVFTELANDVKKLRELGLLDFMMMMQKGRTIESAEAAPPPPVKGKK